MEKRKNTLIFLMGFISCAFLLYILFFVQNINYITGFAIGNNQEVSSPMNRIPNKDILVFPDRVVLLVQDATLTNYDDTGSMNPTIGKNTKGIRISPKEESEIQVGDIVSFRRNNVLIVHRVIERGIDEEGVFFITKGDNNPFPDEKIRFQDIEYLTLAIIW
jgi:hypothetical protein